MSLTIAKPLQRLELRGPDYYAVLGATGAFLDLQQRPPLTAEEVAAFRDAGGEFEFYEEAERYLQIINGEMPEFLQEPEA